MVLKCRDASYINTYHIAQHMLDPRLVQHMDQEEVSPVCSYQVLVVVEPLAGMAAKLEMDR